MKIVGIDLGTTNSLIGVWQEGGARLIPNAAGSLLTPSAVALEDDGEFLIGQAARERLFTRPNHAVAAFKRRMGTGHQYRLGKREFRPEELSALIIRQLLADAERELGDRPEEAVISVPAYFSDAQRKATRIAGELAGLKVERLINEPTAAAIAYRLHEDMEDRRIIVIDLGGGTLDVSVLEFFEGIMQVHATTGDNYLGGEDFDRQLRDHFLTTRNLIAGDLSPAEAARLNGRIQRARHQLTVRDSADIRFDRKGPVRTTSHTLTVTREEFERSCGTLLDRLRATIERALKDSRISVAELDDVVLVGGATRMPMVRHLIGRLFRRLPLANQNPDQVVARGAAVQAGLKADDAALQDVVLTDVCPYTLGIEVALEKRGQYEAGHFLPIIERNSPVPISRVQEVSPVNPQDSEIECRVFQGESRLVKNNVELGKLMVTVPPTGDRDVCVRFTYDINGILEVDTEVPSTGWHHNMVIVNSTQQLSEADIRQRLDRLAAIKIHPKDVQENRSALARAERIYEESLGAERELVAAHIRHFEAALESQDPDTIDGARERLVEFLDEIDVRPFG